MANDQKYIAIIADNQELTRRGIFSILNESDYFSSIIFVNNSVELEGQLSTLKPELLIIDIDLFDIESVESLCEILAKSANTRVLIVSDNKSKDDIIKLRDSGIKNYILKTVDLEEFSDAIQATLNNRKFYSEEVIDLLIDSSTAIKETTDRVRFTASEIEIIRFISQGMTTKDIAAKKCLSHHTIITHRKNIFRKAGVSSTSELIMQAIRLGIVDALEYYI
jgi:DNA-binding NarL/FixJ family response regulator